MVLGDDSGIVSEENAQLDATNAQVRIGERDAGAQNSGNTFGRWPLAKSLLSFHIYIY